MANKAYHFVGMQNCWRIDWPKHLVSSDCNDYRKRNGPRQSASGRAARLPAKQIAIGGAR